MVQAIRFKQNNLPRQPGELARFKVVQGSDYGLIYVMMASQVTLGRGEENGIVISDLKISRVHAEIKKEGNQWKVRDLQSGNGILHNGEKVLQSVLKSNDYLTIGETILEFFSSEAPTLLLKSPVKTREEFQAEQRRISKLKDHSLLNASEKGLKNSPWMGLGIVVLGLFTYFFLDDTEPKKKNTLQNKREEENLDLASYLPKVETTKSVENLFQAGMREYLLGNLKRAKKQFETVLQIVPEHTLSHLYLESCRYAIENSSRYHLQLGSKSLSAGRLRQSKAHFIQVLRLLSDDQKNPHYEQAKEQLKHVIEMIKAEGSTS